MRSLSYLVFVLSFIIIGTLALHLHDPFPFHSNARCNLRSIEVFHHHKKTNAVPTMNIRLSAACLQYCIEDAESLVAIVLGKDVEEVTMVRFPSCNEVNLMLFLHLHR